MRRITNVIVNTGNVVIIVTYDIIVAHKIVRTIKSLISNVYTIYKQQ